MNKIITAGSIMILLSCAPTVTQDLYWIDQYGGQVPIIVTQVEDTTTMEWKPDTINEITH